MRTASLVTDLTISCHRKLDKKILRIQLKSSRQFGHQTVTNDVFENIQNGCGDIPGVNTTTTINDFLRIVDDQPCVSAVFLGRFQNLYYLNVPLYR